MKKIFLLFVTMVIGTMIFAQQSAVSIDTSKLSPEAKAEISKIKTAEKIDSKIQEVGKWAGCGKEIGVAVNSVLGAIADNVDKVGNTKVGKFTMFLVAYKVIGRDIIGFILIPLIMLVVLFTFMWLFKKFCFPYRYISQDALKDEKGKITQPAKYNVSEPEYMINARAWLVALFVVIEVVLTIIMFYN
jgi:flagellar basal body-associated protein FliL